VISGKKNLFDILVEKGVKFFNLSDQDEILGVCGSENGKSRKYGFHEEIDIFDQRISDMKKFRNLLYAKYHIIRDLKKEFHVKWKESLLWKKYIREVPIKVIEKNANKIFTIIIHLLVVFIAFFVGSLYGNKFSLPT